MLLITNLINELIIGLKLNNRPTLEYSYYLILKVGIWEPAFMHNKEYHQKQNLENLVAGINYFGREIDNM